jgi:hypothetical protein
VSGAKQEAGKTQKERERQKNLIKHLTPKAIISIKLSKHRGLAKKDPTGERGSRNSSLCPRKTHTKVKDKSKGKKR